jgi:aminomethyltransferase
MDAAVEVLKHTPLYDAHVALGARMVPFAGYAMPVQYEGVMAEHKWSRTSAGLFDVSHMGQARLRGQNPTQSFEKLVPSDIIGLNEGRQKYSLLLNETGGVLDDLMVSRPDGDGLFVVVNGACKVADFVHMRALIGSEVQIEELTDRALLALQGPKAVDALATHIPEVTAMKFMDSRTVTAWGHACVVSRSGYTGDDGFEISIPASIATQVWNALLTDERVKPIGLGARDSLRLEAGLPLYGHDMDPTRSPIEAGVGFAVPKRRREAADFPGAARIVTEFTHGPKQKWAGLRIHSGAPAREGAEIADSTGTIVGRVTSGGFAPTLGYAIAVGYVDAAHTAPGTALQVIVRGKAGDAEVVALPFVPHTYVR